jgi:hypothetical protein
VAHTAAAVLHARTESSPTSLVRVRFFLHRLMAPLPSEQNFLISPAGVLAAVFARPHVARFLKLAFLRLGYWLILRKISPNYVLPSPGSERREVTTISAKPTALFAAVWSRSSPLVVVIMNRGVANVLNNTYRLISRLPMVKRNSIRN